MFKKRLNANFSSNSAAMCFVRCYNLDHKFCVAVCVLLLKLSYLQQNKHFAGGTDTNSFRFHDFEPRWFQYQYSNGTFKPKISIVHRRHFDDPNHKNETQGDNGNVNYSNSDRESRGFHFHSTDKDTTVEVEFIIPFVRVPIERGMKLTRSTMRNLMDLRSSSLLWAGAFVAVGTLVAGAFNSISSLIPAFLPHNKRTRHVHRRNSDVLDDFMRSSTISGENPYDIGTLLNEKLMEQNIDLNACMQRMICRYVENAADDVRSGKASGTQKILDGFLSTQLLKQYFSGTAVQIAIEDGRNSNCHKWKKRCKLPRFEKLDFLNNIFK